jgi:hypothetical protein
MSVKGQKRRVKINLRLVFLIAAIAIIFLSINALKRPSITGYAVITKESTHSDDLNLQINESANITWTIRNPGDLQSIKAAGALSRNGSAKVYIQKGDEKLLIFDSNQVLFDVGIEVLPDYKSIFQGDELLVQITLFNLRGFGKVEVNVKYSIKDSIGNMVATEEEPISVETQTKFVRKLLIPNDLKPGNYVAFVEVTTPKALVGTGSDSFEVASKFGPQRSRIGYVLGIAVAVALIAILIALGWLWYIRFKGRSRLKKLKRAIPKDKILRLQQELRALENGYQSKFISKESYTKGKARIKKEMDAIKKG